MNNTTSKYNNNSHIYVLALGGTIASLSSDKSGEFYSGPVVDIHSLISLLPSDTAPIKISCLQFMNKISSNINYEDLINIGKKINELANDPEIDGIVVVSGTNTLEEIAYFISLVINSSKNIVFTGAYRPGNSLGYDGIRNLYNAINIAAFKDLSGYGVMLTFNDKIISARNACKSDPSFLGDFTINEAGKIGSIQDKKIFIQSKPYFKHTYLSDFNINQINKLEQVYVIYGYLGVSSDFITLAIKNKVKGIVSAGMGKGYQPEEVTSELIRASNMGIVIVRCSRTGLGQINRELGVDDKYNFIAGGTLTPQKSSILLSLALTVTDNPELIQKIFNEY